MEKMGRDQKEWRWNKRSGKRRRESHNSVVGSVSVEVVSSSARSVPASSAASFSDSPSPSFETTPTISASLISGEFLFIGGSSSSSSSSPPSFSVDPTDLFRFMGDDSSVGVGVDEDDDDDDDSVAASGLELVVVVAEDEVSELFCSGVSLA